MHDLPQGMEATDRAVLKNQQRFKEMMDAKNKKLADNVEEGFKLPQQYRFIIEMFAIGFFVSFFGIVFYRKKFKHLQSKKPTHTDEVFGDDITFYNPKTKKRNSP